MFGLDQISWGSFVQFIALILLAWYLGMLILAGLKTKQSRQSGFYEDHQEDDFHPEKFQPINVSAKDFPSELISPIPVPDIPLQVSFYEETGMDEGYAIDHFLDGNDTLLPTLLDQIQFQQ